MSGWIVLAVYVIGPPGCLIWIPTVMTLHQEYRAKHPYKPSKES